MKVYLSGPMRGHEDENLALFNQWEKMLTAIGCECVNPHDEKLSAEDPLSDIGAIMARNIANLAKCDCLVCLTQDKKSTGMAAEIHFARAVGITVFVTTGDFLKMIRTSRDAKK